MGSLSLCIEEGILFPDRDRAQTDTFGTAEGEKRRRDTFIVRLNERKSRLYCFECFRRDKGAYTLRCCGQPRQGRLLIRIRLFS
ncbi:hypothetical protein EVAR_49545_1 [Eumeta japonica]|uniref:Uncharacterized protein n=1 Tax=Eumeta variegata TaxID=151549 RepID=A0A4C1XKG7_EUMVA|nr:hypothetical protein EVAR_49545_1 [Eumeta japonica]